MPNPQSLTSAPDAQQIRPAAERRPRLRSLPLVSLAVACGVLMVATALAGVVLW